MNSSHWKLSHRVGRTRDICASLKFSNNGNCVIKVEGERFPGRVLDSTERTLDPSGRAEEKGRKWGRCWTEDALYVIRLGQGGFHEVSVGVRESPDGTLSGKQQRNRPGKWSGEFLSPRIRSMFVKEMFLQTRWWKPSNVILSIPMFFLDQFLFQF